MPMDGFTLSFMQRELHHLLVGGRVDKVNQPERDTLLITIRNRGENHRLLLSANANHARAQLTAQPYENPAEPPMFCMLMRKHLQGAHIIALRQLGGDRILALTLQGLGELGDTIKKTIYLEIMGRHSNLILVDDSGRIVDSIKHVNQEMSRVRTVLPGLAYMLPPQGDKFTPEECTAENLLTRFAPLTMTFQKALAENIAGLASLCSLEICAQLSVDGSIPCTSLSWDRMAPLLSTFLQNVHHKISPVLLQDDLGQNIDFFPFPYLTYPGENQRAYPTLSQAMDAYYSGRDLRFRMQQRSAGLQRHIKNAIDRLEKKKVLLLDTLSQSEKAEQNRIYGELLTTHLYTIDKSMTSVTLENYYSPLQEQVTIPLSTQKTPSQNAQHYFKLYRKSKAAQEHASQQLLKADDELFLLESALEDLDKCSTTTDLAEIRRLLSENGYIRSTSTERKHKKIQEGQPYRFTSPDGTEILVGKNSLQNDRLTLHARGGELWLHAQGIPGSHVLIKSESEPSDETLLWAAKLAAYFSKGRNHPALPVDYTRRKHVKKAAGSPAGFVTYTHFQTILIGLTPKDIAAIAKSSTQ